MKNRPINHRQIAQSINQSIDRSLTKWLLQYHQPTDPKEPLFSCLYPNNSEWKRSVLEFENSKRSFNHTGFFGGRCEVMAFTSTGTIPWYRRRRWSQLAAMRGGVIGRQNHFLIIRGSSLLLRQLPSSAFPVYIGWSQITATALSSFEHCEEAFVAGLSHKNIVPVHHDNFLDGEEEN